MPEQVDLVVDLNAEDETGLPWAFLDAATDRRPVVVGSHIVVGSGDVSAVAVVVDVADGIVHVRPLPGPVSRHRRLLQTRRAS